MNFLDSFPLKPGPPLLSRTTWLLGFLYNLVTGIFHGLLCNWGQGGGGQFAVQIGHPSDAQLSLITPLLPIFLAYNNVDVFPALSHRHNLL